MSSSPESHSCYNRFFESIQAAYSSPAPPPTVEDSGTGSDAIQVLRWLADGRSPPHLDVLSYEEEGVGNLSLEDLRMRNRLINWAEIFRGMQDCPFQIESDEALAEGEGGGRKGALPAAKSAIEALTFEVEEGERMIVVCAVCKDAMVMGEIGKKLPCGHCYHGNCIVPWLGIRNSCPVCRFQLQTDDAEHEEDRKKRTTLTDSSSSSSSSSSSQQVNRRMSNRIRKPNRRIENCVNEPAVIYFNCFV